MKSVYKGLLPIFIGMALISCAGTDSSVQKKEEVIPNLFKAGTSIADTLASRMPEFARSVFKKTIDSVPGEYYYYASNGRIDSLIQKEDEQYKAVASIAYNSPNDQSNYEIKSGNLSYSVKNGVLDAELDFPRYIKKYWSNGNPKDILTGFLYRDDQGIIKVDSGRSEVYFESGKIYQQNAWKDKQPVTSRQWNENGTLTREIDFPKYIKTYWDNGNPQSVLTGLVYIDNQGNFQMDSGREEIYSEAGKLIEQTDWNNKQPIACKKWNENGMLTMEVNFQTSCIEYWNNGKIKQKGEGVLYRNDGTNSCRVDSGRSEVYFEDGKIEQQNEWKNKLLVKQKEWNENGVLLKEIDFPRYFKIYWNDGKLKEIGTGLLYRNNQDVIQVDSGRSEVYFEDGKIKEQNDWKGGQTFASKQWNETGVLIKEFVIPKYFKEYWNNGKPREILTGKLFISNQGNFALDSGRSKIYFENGKLEQQKDWENKQTVAYKQWNEKEVLIIELDFPKYAKEYYDNGKIKKEMTGLYWASLTNVEVENGYKKDYYENGKTKVLVNYKEKKPYSSKQWNEDGTLSMEWNIPAGYSKYYEDGRLRLEKKGSLYLGEEDVLLENGYQILYFKNGKPQFQEQYENKQTIGKKIWDENGTLVIEEDLSKGFRKAYFPSGKISRYISGKFHYKDKKIIFEDCSVKNWYENGQTMTHLNYKEQKLISKTLWYPNGNLSITAELPNHYRTFYEDGKIMADVTGTIVEEDGDFKVKDGTYNEYDQNGEVTYSATYKDFQKTSEKGKGGDQ